MVSLVYAPLGLRRYRFGKDGSHQERGMDNGRRSLSCGRRLFLAVLSGALLGTLSR